MKNKDLILLTAYTPDLERKNILLNALKSIDKNKFDIMVSSHSSISEEALKYCDYFIYDKNNTLLFDPKYKLSFWFSCDAFKLYTTEYKDYNHIIAAGSLTINGLSSAKNFGYNKVHWFDYDTIFSDDSELIENSNLLNTHSTIWYKHPDLTAFSGMSFNLNEIDQDWFNTSDSIFYSFLDTSTVNTLEEFNYLLTIKKDNHYEKNISDLNKKINIALYSADDSDWAVIVYDSINETFMFFNYNKTGNVNEVSVIVNNSQIKTFFTQQKEFYYAESIGKAKDIQYIKIIMNNKVIKDYDFNITNKEEYILKNKIEYIVN
jgi:hypothetical protein